MCFRKNTDFLHLASPTATPNHPLGPLGRVTSRPCSRKRMGRSSNLGGFRAGAWDTVQLGRMGLRHGVNGLRYQNIHTCMVTETVDISAFI